MKFKVNKKFNKASTMLKDHYEFILDLSSDEQDDFFVKGKIIYECRKWLDENVGDGFRPDGKSWAASSMTKPKYFMFTDKDDAMLFKLTWG